LSLLARWVDEAAGVRPERAAVITADRQLTFAELAACAESLARMLRQRGIGEGRVVAVLSSSPSLIGALAYAVPRLGGILFPLNPALSPERLAALLRQSGAEWVIAEGDVAPGVPDACRWLEAAAVAQCWESAPQPAIRTRSEAAGEEAIELIIATSGSAGEPKGVMLSGRNLAASAAASRSRIPLAAGDVWLACLPLYHVGGVSMLYRCAEAGAAVLLHEGFDPIRIGRDLGRHGVTHISLVPAMLARLLEAGVRPSQALRCALVGGGPLSRPLFERAMAAGWPVCPTYGMTETASQAATLCPGEQWAEGAVGSPLPGFEVEIADTGRIRIRGEAVMVGYANPQRRPGEGLRQGWFETGDLGRLDAQGNLIWVGRADEMLVSGGVNVHPREVEMRLAACPGVRDVAVSAVPDEVWGDRLVAFVVGEASPEQVQAWCRTALAGPQRPRRVIPVAALPRNALGKLERRVLRDMAREAGC
jgi:O-succinylbenzoic acid--CoA ligase